MPVVGGLPNIGHLAPRRGGVAIVGWLRSMAGPPIGMRPSWCPWPRRDREPNRWAVLALLGVAQLIVVLYATIVTIATPSAQEALHFSMESRQWIVTAYALAFGGGAGLLTRLVAASTPASRARRADR
ncbi:MAG TPA: hypothetical protein VGI67_07145 [Thermoleophilaceae bacterium]